MPTLPSNHCFRHGRPRRHQSGARSQTPRPRRGSVRGSRRDLRGSADHGPRRRNCRRGTRLRRGLVRQRPASCAGTPCLRGPRVSRPRRRDAGHSDDRGGPFRPDNFRRALRLAESGRADAVFFTPFNKKAMRLAYPGYDDEVRFINDVLGRAVSAGEFNILGDLWNARVTSHIPLSQVPGAITEAAILRSLRLTHDAMTAAGFARPRIAVAALNPHAGDGGNFGREEIDLIEPAVQKGSTEGIAVDGPFQSDTVFLGAKGGQYDAVLTMYHDQGQIAMKLMGFERGVTMLGGYPFPICTPAHGTAYDIAGRGIANPGAAREAFLLAARAASRRISIAA